jgi:hypothetical protein
VLPGLAILAPRGLFLLSGLAIACLSSGWYLWSSRGLSGFRMVRIQVWLLFILSALTLSFLGYVLWFADFSWMNQK